MNELILFSTLLVKKNKRTACNFLIFHTCWAKDCAAEGAQECKFQVAGCWVLGVLISLCVLDWSKKHQWSLHLVSTFLSHNKSIATPRPVYPSLLVIHIKYEIEIWMNAKKLQMAKSLLCLVTTTSWHSVANTCMHIAKAICSMKHHLTQRRGEMTSYLTN